MPNNYILLERIELNASAASVTFSNIPQTGYTDLKLVFSARDDNSAVYNNMLLTFNGSTTGYSERVLGGTGSATFSSSQSASSLQFQYINSANSTANSFSNGEFYIPNYTSSNYKSVSVDNVQENNATSAVVGLAAQLWSNSAAITTIKLEPASSKLFQANSTFSLYGLAALGTTPAIAPKASGGNIIDYDGTYWIHTFLSSGTFTPQTGLTCDYLVVAGGGGAGGVVGGGGGAGGLRSTVGATGGGGSLESALAVVSGTAYTVTVGAGGAGGNGNANGTSGNNSVFSTITSTAGGGGGHNTNNGLTGGSGGGGANANTTAPGTGGAGTTNQGFAGGNANNNAFPTGASGGGGGAGSVGAAASGATGGSGGSGVTTSISGSSVAYAGGGGGWGGTTAGTATAGGGASASGSGSANGTAGTTNRGGGGGGGANGGIGGTGGSGIVIIRYLA
jgi:hypothetical protein